MERIKVTQHTSLGAFWFAGWLFTIGYLHLNFWMGLLGLFCMALFHRNTPGSGAHVIIAIP